MEHLKAAIDFSAKMSIYELLALIISIIALLTPVIKFTWKKIFRRAKLEFMPTGTANLFFNQSGPYLRIDGVYEAKNQPVAIKGIDISITRKRDDRKLNLSWSYFYSPINQNVVGNIVQTTEKVHPFRIEENSIACAFTEFSDMMNTFGKTFQLNTESLFENAQQLRLFCSDYAEAVARYRASEQYKHALSLIEKDYFWDIGTYDIAIITKFNKSTATFCYSMMVDESSYKALHDNIDESLVAPLKKEYNVRWNFQNAIVEISKKKD